jgi:hypothetical protein
MDQPCLQSVSAAKSLERADTAVQVRQTVTQMQTGMNGGPSVQARAGLSAKRSRAQAWSAGTAEQDPDATAEELEEELEWEDWNGRGSFVHHMIAGSVAGVVEHLCMFPVDTVKVRPPFLLTLLHYCSILGLLLQRSACVHHLTRPPSPFRRTPRRTLLSNLLLML